MPTGKMTLGLFDPGMTDLHKVGLAGLYIGLSALNKDDFSSLGDWKLFPNAVELSWKDSPTPFFKEIFSRVFKISDGTIRFNSHEKQKMGDLQRLLFHEAMLQTFLQHGPTSRETEKKEKSISIQYENKTIVRKIKSLLSYNHQNANFFLQNNELKTECKLTGWIFPGGVVRHNAFRNSELIDPPERFIPLIFAPLGALFYLISHRTPDGKYDYRKSAAIVLPKMVNLETYSRNYLRYLNSPVENLYANSLGDAGLIALTQLNLYQGAGMLSELETDSCTLITLGTVPWSKQQKTRTKVLHFQNLDIGNFKKFELAIRTLRNKVKWKDKKNEFWVKTSLCRGLIADNIFQSKPWYSGFSSLICSRKRAEIISYERKGLSEMIQKVEWDCESEKLFITAVHQAIRCRYGALASRAKASGEKPRFDREFERIRTSLMRAKNCSTVRGEMADLFAKSGINSVLQENWEKLLGLFSGKDWQKTRDLALLALASYSDQGADGLDENTDDSGESEDKEEE